MQAGALNSRVPDPFRFTTIAHSSHAFLGPVSETSVTALLERIPIATASRVLDVGCGKGELLARTLERLGGTGVGVEPNPTFAADARARAAQHLSPDAAIIIEKKFTDADLGEHAFTLGICTGSLHAFGDWSAAIDGMSRLVTADGWALMAPGYWKQPPSPDYLEILGGREEELRSLRETTATAKARGWQLIAGHESTLAEWDAYEHAYAANVRAWCAAHPDDVDAKPFGDRIEHWSTAYETWGRDTMGYALLLLRRMS